MSLLSCGLWVWAFLGEMEGPPGGEGQKFETSIQNAFDLQHIFLQIIAYLGFFFFLNESNEL